MPAALAHAAAPTRPPARPAGPAVLRRCACGGKPGPSGECEECRAKRLGLRRSASAPAAPAFAPPLVHHVLCSPAQPLDAGTRADLEPRLGHSFADVRVHADARAAESAAAVSAHAYTVGRDVVFGAGRYAPGTMEGRRLIAHELAHVVQQSASGAAIQPRLEIGAADAPEERAADDVAARVMEGGADAVTSALASPKRLARAPRHGTEEMHRDIRERWRRERGIPPEGRDERGVRAGPSDSELIYGGRWIGLPCPPPGGPTAELMCFPGQYRADGPTCMLTEEHWRHLGPAQADARARLRRARRVLAAPSIGPGLAARTARSTFTGTPPSIATITTTLERMETVFDGALISGASCEAPDCQSPAVLAFVTGAGRGPVFLCPRSWLGDQLHKLERTLLHEVAHLVGIDAARTTDEVYCRHEECGTACAGAEVVDAWAQFIHCLGQPPIRTDFTDRTVRSVEEAIP